MKGKINQLGNLCIERAGKMRDQYCPYARGSDFEYRCCDSCPLFGEPRTEFVSGIKTGNIEIELSCHGLRLSFDEFVDERKKGE